MKKNLYKFSLLILLIFYSKVLFSQHNLRDSLLSEFESKNYSNCIEIISENIDSIKRYHLVGAIEFWTLNLWAGNFDSLVIKNYILPLKTHKMDSLSLILYGETKKNKEQLIGQIEISNLNSSAKTANLIFLDFLCLESEKDILEFKKNLKDSINIIKKNLTEFSDSVYYQIYDIDYKYSGALFSLSASTYLYQNYLYNRSG